MDPPGAAAPHHDSDAPTADDHGTPAGAGRWVESSWDLRQGLTVREGLPLDAVLEEWIEAQLRSN